MRGRPLGAVVALTLLSQFLSALNVVLLSLLGAETADTYAIASQVGLSGFTGVVVGILYNIAIGRVGFRGWGRWGAIAAAVTVAFTVGQALLLERAGYFERHDGVFVVCVLAAFGAGGALTCIAAVTGVRRACLGRPALFAAMTVLPNGGFLLGTVVASVSAWGLAPAVGWLVGSAAVLLVSIFTQRLDYSPEDQGAATAREPYAAHIVGLTIGLFASTVMPLFYVASIATLSAGTVYVAALVARIANASVALTVNSVLLVKYKWGAPGASSFVVPTALGVAYVILALGAIIGNATQPAWLLWNIVVIVGWVAAVIASAIVVREVNARRKGKSILAKAIIECALTAVAASLLWATPSLVGYFAAFAVSQTLTIAIGGAALRKVPLALVGGAGCIASMVLIVLGW